MSAYKKQGIRFFARFLLGIFLLYAKPAGANISSETGTYETVADFVCGMDNSDENSAAFKDILISFHNPNKYPVMVNNIFELKDHPDKENPEPSEQYLNILISPNRTFQLSCRRINDLFFPGASYSSEISRSFKGYIHSRSTKPVETVIESSKYYLQ